MRVPMGQGATAHLHVLQLVQVADGVLQVGLSHSAVTSMLGDVHCQPRQYAGSHGCEQSAPATWARTGRAAYKSTCALCAILVLDADTPMLTGWLLQFVCQQIRPGAPSAIRSLSTCSVLGCGILSAHCIRAGHESARVEARLPL